VKNQLHAARSIDKSTMIRIAHVILYLYSLAAPRVYFLSHRRSISRRPRPLFPASIGLQDPTTLATQYLTYASVTSRGLASSPPRDAARASLAYSFLAASRSRIHSLTNVRDIAAQSGAVRLGGRVALGLAGSPVLQQITQQPPRPYPRHSATRPSRFFLRFG